jgi:hypothetical protein
MKEVDYMYAKQLEALRAEVLYFEVYQGGKFIQALKGTAETLETYKNIYRIDRISKFDRLVTIHLAE